MGYDADKGFTSTNVDPSWEALLSSLEKLGVDKETAAQNMDFIKDFVRDAQKTGPAAAAGGGKKKVPPPPPVPRRTHGNHDSLSAAPPSPAAPPPPPPAYSPQAGMQSSGIYSPPYPMDTTSPAPSSQNLSAHSSARPSISQPSTPLSYIHPPPSTSPAHFFKQEHQPMTVEAPPRRRLSGLRRVRDQRDLRPYVSGQPVGRRMDATGIYLSVSVFWLPHCRT